MFVVTFEDGGLAAVNKSVGWRVMRNAGDGEGTRSPYRMVPMLVTSAHVLSVIRCPRYLERDVCYSGILQAAGHAQARDVVAQRTKEQGVHFVSSTEVDGEQGE